IASCRDTPGWPMSTNSTSSLTERSPWRSASISRRRVGSARTWNTSGIPTYYCSNICLVNDMSGGDAFQAAHLGQLGRRLLAVVEALDAVHLVLDLIPRGADAELEAAAGQVVDGDRQLGQHDRVAVGVARDHAADAHALGRLSHRRLQRPTLVHRTAGSVGPD